MENVGLLCEQCVCGSFSGHWRGEQKQRNFVVAKYFSIFHSFLAQQILFFFVCSMQILNNFPVLSAHFMLKIFTFFWGEYQLNSIFDFAVSFFYNAKCNSLTHFEAAHTTQRNRIIIQMICMWFYTFCTVAGECWIIKHTKQLCVLFFPRALMCWYLIAFRPRPCGYAVAAAPLVIIPVNLCIIKYRFSVTV